MTKVKFCGLTRLGDIKAANALLPDYVGFVFVSESRRCVSAESARALKQALHPGILSVGVFVNEPPERVAELLESRIIDIAQLHGDEEDGYIRELRRRSKKPLIKAFRFPQASIEEINNCTADYVLLDSGAGTGNTFNWYQITGVKRPYFLAGGLDPGNVADAIRLLHPFAVDISSGIESDGVKDKKKMAAFITEIRKEDRK